MGASVKVMLSFDYCHFEVCKSTDVDISNEEIDVIRKDCMRLADKAIEQYKIAKQDAFKRTGRIDERSRMQREVNKISEKAECDRTVNECATIKAFQDRNWEEYISSRYDYQDDWPDDDDQDDDDII